MWAHDSAALSELDAMTHVRWYLGQLLSGAYGAPLDLAAAGIAMEPPCGGGGGDGGGSSKPVAARQQQHKSQQQQAQQQPAGAAAAEAGSSAAASATAAPCKTPWGAGHSSVPLLDCDAAGAAYLLCRLGMLGEAPKQRGVAPAPPHVSPPPAAPDGRAA
eukprot:100718-Chlamydomonas_euryale.AAC.3